jgi:hypothetical protein
MLFTGHLTIFAIIFLLRKHIQVYVVKNLACGSLYFWSYTPWKIGFVASFWLYLENGGVGDSLRLYPEKLGGWSLLPVEARKQRKLVLPMNVIL